MSNLGNRRPHVCSCSFFKLGRTFFKSTCFLFLGFYQFILVHSNPLSMHLLYFLFFSFLGFGILKVLKPRTHPSFTPRNIDLLFTSVSATAVSSMSTVEMEVFSNTQLLVLTILMLVGGEVFTSMLGLHLGRWFKSRKIKNKVDAIISTRNIHKINSSSPPSTFLGQLDHHDQSDMATNKLKPEANHELHIQIESSSSSVAEEDLIKYNSIRFLSFVVLGYLVLINVLGVGLLFVYLAVVSRSARQVLRSKGLKLFTFSIFTIVSTFTNCGFVPTNENMMVFSNNSVFLLILIPQILLGNTLFPSCLRFSIWVLGKVVKRVETSSSYLLKNSEEIGYTHLLPSLHSIQLVVTVTGFIFVQFILFCSMEWNSAALSGLNYFQKVVGVFFQTVNSRHAGETIVDLSTISAAVLVLFVVMMYLPPYTSFIPIKEEGKCPEENEIRKKKKKRRIKVVVENLRLSQLSYIAIFIILICITERKSMKEDPLNFNVLNIVVEVVSAYGNVGFSMGYSCERQLKGDGSCKDKWYGFSGRWSDQGKIILIVVMFFGRLKKFNMDGGRAWKLL